MTSRDINTIREDESPSNRKWRERVMAEDAAGLGDEAFDTVFAVLTIAHNNRDLRRTLGAYGQLLQLILRDRAVPTSEVWDAIREAAAMCIVDTEPAPDYAVDYMTQLEDRTASARVAAASAPDPRDAEIVGPIVLREIIRLLDNGRPETARETALSALAALGSQVEPQRLEAFCGRTDLDPHTPHHWRRKPDGSYGDWEDEGDLPWCLGSPVEPTAQQDDDPCCCHVPGMPCPLPAHAPVVRSVDAPDRETR